MCVCVCVCGRKILMSKFENRGVCIGYSWLKKSQMFRIAKIINF